MSQVEPLQKSLKQDNTSMSNKEVRVSHAGRLQRTRPERIVFGQRYFPQFSKLSSLSKKKSLHFSPNKCLFSPSAQSSVLVVHQ